jgi:SAM-dependent methyltransferase
MEICWCGQKKLENFSSDYLVCRSCQTLVSKFDSLSELEKVDNDESDFYGMQYWLEGSKEFPDIHARSRSDLSERNLHWLKFLLQFKLPPAKILEIGCAHGSFLGLLKHIGFDCYGMEMSPWVMEYARKTFDITMYPAPIENAKLEGNQFDMIVMMDVVEHLSDPAGTLQKCIEHLSPDGVFLIQVPCFPNHLPPEKILNNQHPFEQMMIPNEHLYLFSQESIEKLFKNLGFSYIEYLPAIFSHYDMFLVISRKPLKKNTSIEIDAFLQTNINGRVIQALLDLREIEQKNVQNYINLSNATKSWKWNLKNLFRITLSKFK